MSAEHPLHNLAAEIGRDLGAAQGKLTELMRQIGEYDLPIPVGVECPKCGIERASERLLAEHLYSSHDGPVPDHYLDIEARSLDPVEPEVDE